MQNLENRNSLIIELINEYEKMHESICDRSQRLETKAQINASIAGIFIAFVFSAVKDLKTVLDQLELLMLFLSFGCLIICIVSSLLTLFIQFKKYNPNSEIMNDLLQNTTKENFQIYTIKFYNTLLFNWNERVKNVKKQRMFKAICVIIAQCFLFAAVISISFLIYHLLSR